MKEMSEQNAEHYNYQMYCENCQQTTSWVPVKRPKTAFCQKTNAERPINQPKCAFIYRCEKCGLVREWKKKY